MISSLLSYYLEYMVSGLKLLLVKYKINLRVRRGVGGVIIK